MTPMIYFIQPVDGGPIKIGFAKDIADRVKHLETETGKHMVVLASISGGKSEVQKLHQQFAYLRYGRTENFRPTPELMSVIMWHRSMQSSS